VELRIFRIVSESRRREMDLQISEKIFIFSGESIVSEFNGVGLLRLRAEQYKLSLIL